MVFSKEYFKKIWFWREKSTADKNSWKNTSTQHIIRTNFHLSDSGNFTCIRLDLYLKRNIGYYMIQMYIPSGLVVMLSWLSFWLHVEAVPARVTLGILTVLTMTTQRSMANTSLARVSYVKAMDVWMATCLCFVFCALLEYAFVNVISRQKTKRRRYDDLEKMDTETTVGIGRDR